MKKFSWKDYFIFTKGERTIALIIIILFAGIMSAPYFFRSETGTPVTTAFQELRADNQDTIFPDEIPYYSKKPYSKKASKEISTADLFYFDPNTLDKAGWLQLGLSAKMAQTILHYRGKGGRFRRAEDIRKIYGLSKRDADKLVPFVRIDGSSNVFVKRDDHKNAGSPVFQKREIHSIDINKATVEEWKSLPGIGDVLSNRIVKFRNACGGFHSIEDVRKTYGLNDSVFENIRQYLQMSEDTVAAKRKATKPPAKININTATEREMKEAHLFSPSMLKAIIIYRKQHNGFRSVEELKNIPFISDDVYQKTAPNLVTE